MKTLSVDLDVRKKFEAIADKFPVNTLHDVEQNFCACFDFIPSEDYERACLQAKREEMKADAYKDVMMTFLKYITLLADDRTVMANSQFAVSTYEATFTSAVNRFERLEQDLEAVDQCAHRDSEWY